MLRKVKQYDGKLSTILQVFQVCRRNYHSYYFIQTFLQARLFLSLLAHIIQQRNGTQPVDHTPAAPALRSNDPLELLSSRLPQMGRHHIESGTPVPHVVDISNQELEECGLIIRGLPYTGGWPFGDEKRCLPGTREDFLDYIVEWVENPHQKK
ncbi:hypothetical protein BGW80DRAFT_1308514 [Lactifluus volemus]|nr:hypothetical protein BGW80DRAFT_1308514 [Lactifluus volemus]